MNGTWIISWMKSRAVMGVCAALLLCGCFRLFTFSPEEITGLNFAQGYSLANNLAFACFVFVPLFGFVLARSAQVFLIGSVAIAFRSRKMIACRCVGYAFQQSACFAVALNVATLPALLVHYQVTWDAMLTILSALVLQTLFFSICAMIFLVLYFATHSPALSYIAVLMYGLWDFMASNIVGGGVPFFGWGLTTVQLPLFFPTMLTSLLFLVTLIGLFFAAILFVVDRMDFLQKQAA